jgi:hypothetical protein
MANNPKLPVLGTSLSNANTPQALVLNSSTQTLTTQNQNSTSNSSVGNSQTSGISIEQRNAPRSMGLSMMFAVSLPKGTSTVGVGFSFDLPESVRTEAADSSDVRANLANGSALPEWLKFNPRTLNFYATSIPDGAFPMQVALTFGGKRTLLVISERTD